MIDKAIAKKNIGNDISGARLLRDDEGNEMGWWDTSRKTAYLCSRYEYLKRLMLRLSQHGIDYDVVDCQGRMKDIDSDPGEDLYAPPAGQARKKESPQV